MTRPDARMFSVLLALAVAAAGCAGGPEAPSDTSTTSTSSTPPTTSSHAPVCEPAAFDAAATNAGRSLTFTVREAGGCYAFEGPSLATAGWVDLTLQNDGAEPHVMVLMRILDGHTFDDAMGALMGGGDAPPTWIKESGGVSILDPGATSTVTQRLEPGTYFMFCWVNGHLMMGMVHELRVVAGGDEGASPTADTVLTLDDFNFTFDHPLAPGAHVVAVRNVGEQPHEAPFVALDAGTTMVQFAQALEEGAGPPPGRAVGGVNAFQPGETVYVHLTLTAGPHGLICFVTDPADGMPHVEKGMSYEFDVA